MNTRIALCAAALGATLFVANEASAKGTAGNARQTIEMTRPSNAPDVDAQGTVEVATGANDKVVLHLSKLRPRTRFEIRDSSSGDLVGTVKTNRKGAATFNLTKSVAKAAAAGGSDTGDVTNVDVVDPTTGDTVLTGDTTPAPASPAEGFDAYFDDAGDSADVYMATDGAGADTFSFDFYPAIDPSADPATTTFSYYDLQLDTSNGDALPLGVASVTDLAGRQFEIHAADGTVVLSGDLPALETYDESDEYGGYDGDFGDYFGGCPGMGDPTDPTTDGSSSNAARHGGRKSAKKQHARGARETSTAGFSLFIADADGNLQNAGDLVEETVDYSNDFPSYDFDPFSGDGFNVFITIVIAPTDGSFDFGSFFDDLFGGIFDPSGNDSTGVDSGASAAKHHHR